MNFSRIKVLFTEKKKNQFFGATKVSELQRTVGVRFPVCALNLTDTNAGQMHPLQRLCCVMAYFWRFPL